MANHPKRSEETLYHKEEKLLKDSPKPPKKYFKLLRIKAIYYALLFGLIMLILFLIFSSR